VKLEPGGETESGNRRAAATVDRAAAGAGLVSPDEPRFSVIVPVHSGVAQVQRHVAWLKDCLAAVRKAEGGDDAEILLVDDGSPGPVLEAWQNVAREFGARLTRLAQNAGPAAARNRGARLATGDVLVFLDLDVIPHADLFQRFRAHFSSGSPVDAVMGSYDAQPTAGRLVSDFRNLLHHLTHQRSRPRTTSFWTGCGAVRRDVFWATGGFDEAYAVPSIEDAEFGHRLAAEGRELRLDRQAQVTHQKAWTLGSMVWTDFRHRAVPWTCLMRVAGWLPFDLNFTWTQRFSVGLAGILPLLAFLLMRGYWFGLSLIPAVAAWLILNGRTFQQFRQLRGGWFALWSIPLLWIHHLTSFCGFFAGLAVHNYRRDRWRLLTIPIYVLVALAVQGVTGAYQSDFGGHPDEAGHFVTGVMVRQYLAEPFTHPMTFARDYYAHYPKVAIGHWPPAQYAIHGVWYLITQPTRMWALVLIALAAAATAWLVAVAIRRFTSPPWAVAAGLVLLLMPAFQRSYTMVMSDSMAAALSFAAAMLFARYATKPTALRSLVFGLMAAGALLVKPTAIGVALVPALVILVGWRWDLIRRRDLWLAAVPSLLVVLPWYWLQMQLAYRGAWRSYAGISELGRRFYPFDGMMLARDGGLVVTACATAGFVVAVLMKRRDAWLMAGVALVSGTLLAAYEMRAMNESRHWLPMLPACVVLGTFFLARAVPQPVAVPLGFLAAVLFLLVDFRAVPQPYGGFREMAQEIAQSGHHRVLLSTNNVGDGRVIAELAQREPHPQHILLRAAKLMARTGWNGQVLEMHVNTPEAVLAALDEWRVDQVVVHRTVGAREPRYQLLLEEALNAVPERWSPRTRVVANNSFVTYLRQAPPTGPVADPVLDLRERLGEKFSVPR
jgi:GT2 family glycosyltransferase